MYQVVIDTNVIVAALRSKRGASHRLMSLLGDVRWVPNLSVALVLEYEAAGRRACAEVGIPASIADDLIDTLCARGHQHMVRFRWRRILPDPGDDFVLELAIAARCRYIVTYNKRDFSGAQGFGVEAVTPKEFLRILEGVES
jgi:predicted nucleic acid-binding protein